MTEDFATAMRRSLEATRAGNPAEATRLIQAALGGQNPAPPSPDAQSAQPEREGSERMLGAARFFARNWPKGPVEDAEVLDEAPPGKAPRRTRPESPAPSRERQEPCPPDGARRERRSHSGPAGARDYLLHVPSGPIRGLVVMLHGCTQTSEDFARGTAMDRQGDRHGFAIAYPEQVRTHNAQMCWNWFRPGDQRPERGEPAILKALALEVGQELGVPPGRIFAAGLSAGGAMAAILGQSSPHVFAAIGIHSGLAPGSARDVASAFAAMRGEATHRGAAVSVPAILLHGLSDGTVAPVNMERLAGGLSDTSLRVEDHGGRRVRITSGTGSAGHPVELWRIEGAGHAWAGGDARGSHTDAAGPDASAEMARFFAARLGQGA